MNLGTFCKGLILMICCLGGWAFAHTMVEGSPFAFSIEPRYVTCIRAISPPSTVSSSGTSPPSMCSQTVLARAIFLLSIPWVVPYLVCRSWAVSGEFAAGTRSTSYSRCCRLQYSLLFTVVRGAQLLSPYGKSSSSTFFWNRLSRMSPYIET